MASIASAPGARVLEALVDAAGGERFDQVLFEAAKAHAGVDEIFGYVRDEDGRCRRLVSAGRRRDSNARAALYLERYHRLDPLLGCIRDAADDETSAWRLDADEIVDGAYRRDCFERANLALRVSVVRRRERETFVLSFYRAAPLERGAEPGLLAIADVALPLLRRYPGAVDREDYRALLSRVSRRLAACYPQLTGREQEVCARTLIGMTAEAIALDLQIKPTSVLTYRRRAYERFGISSANQLMGPLLG